MSSLSPGAGAEEGIVWGSQAMGPFEQLKQRSENNLTETSKKKSYGKMITANTYRALGSSSFVLRLQFY